MTLHAKTGNVRLTTAPLKAMPDQVRHGMFIVLKNNYFQLRFFLKSNSHNSTVEQNIGILRIKHF